MRKQVYVWGGSFSFLSCMLSASHSLVSNTSCAVNTIFLHIDII